jgi:hypothetical protein
MMQWLDVALCQYQEKDCRVMSQILHRGTRRLLTGVAGALCCLFLVACSGIKPGKSPWKEFVVDAPVKTAYERAIDQTKQCLISNDPVPITNPEKMPMTTYLAADERSASIKVNMILTGTLLVNIQITALEGDRSRVLVEMWGVNIWDMQAIDAMEAAIKFGVPSCINYFPSATPGAASPR